MMNRRLHAGTLVALLVTVPRLVLAATYYMSPEGADAQAGTTTAPWKTFAHALPQLHPGDTLILKDGTYGIAAGSGVVSIDGATTHRSGTAEQPITVRAENERQALFEGTGRAMEFRAQNCSYWVFEGLSIKSNDANVSGPAAGSTGHPVGFYRCSHIVVRRNLLYQANRYENGSLLLLHETSHCLVEENEGYAFHRHGFAVSNGDHNTFRRNYLHCRLTTDIPPDGIHSGPPDRGDGGITIYPGSHNLVENNIVEMVGCGYGIEATVDSVNNRFYGNIALGSHSGMQFNARGKTLTTMPRDTVVENFVAIGTTYYGVYLRATKNTRCTNCTVAQSEMGGFGADRPDLGGDGQPSAFFTNCLAAANKLHGFNLSHQAQWTVEHSSAFGHTYDFLPPATDPRVVEASAVDPRLGACVLFLSGDSPMRGAGKDGADIGATILYRYRDGALTKEPLWDPATGEFPHGALVAGVNDVPGASCFDVHKRLNVSPATLPAGYGDARGLTKPAAGAQVE